MGVNFIFSGVDNDGISYGKNVRDVIKRIIDVERKKLGVINIILTDNVGILEINSKFLKHEFFTDVITFEENKRNTLYGDIFISVDQVRINSLEMEVKFENELLRVMVHGVLHLIGYNDSSEEEKNVMRNLEDKYLCMFKHM